MINAGTRHNGNIVQTDNELLPRIRLLDIFLKLDIIWISLPNHNKHIIIISFIIVIISIIIIIIEHVQKCFTCKIKFDNENI